MLGRTAQWVQRHRWSVLSAWLLLLVLGVALGPQVFANLAASEQGSPGSESVVAEEKLEQLGVLGPRVLALVDGIALADPGVRERLAGAVDRLRGIPDVQEVADPLANPASPLISNDQRAALIELRLTPDIDTARQADVEQAVTQQLEQVGADRLLVGGPAVLRTEFADQAKRDLVRGEMVALPAMLILLVVLFGSLWAAGLPLSMAAVGISGSLLILLGISQLTDVVQYAVNVVTMVGLALAVDYALLLVMRFREERGNQRSIADAIDTTMRTAGRTVLFSGLTVMIAMAGLLVFAEPWMRSLAYGGVAVVALALASALTLVPALLTIFGRRLSPMAVAGAEGRFARLARFVQRRAALVTVVVAIGLAVLAVPFITRAELRHNGPEVLPASSAVRQLDEAVKTRFPALAVEPILVVVNAPPDAPPLSAFRDRIASLDNAESVTVQPLPNGTTLIRVVPAGSDQGHEATTLVSQLRALDPSLNVEVTGRAAKLADTRAGLAERLPIALGVVALATLVLLFLMTGSVIVPIKAIIMNVLSLGASFGVLIWVFQDGYLSGLLGFTPSGYLDPAVPVLVAMFAFGLSMDYEVFLLGRIKEAYDRHQDNEAAIAEGLQRTGKIITAAALLMAIVFAGLASGQLLFFKAIGLGLATAVLVDAIIVRTLLVPATMTLLGRWNWWAPSPLRKLHQRLGLREESGVEPAHAVADFSTPTTAATPVGVPDKAGS